MATPDVHPKHLDPDGPPHPDRETEIKILRWGLGYGPTEPDPWGQVKPATTSTRSTGCGQRAAAPTTRGE